MLRAFSRGDIDRGQGPVPCSNDYRGQPGAAIPNGKRVDRALASLDFMVTIDIYFNQITRHGDIVLPPTSALEHDHDDLAFPDLSARTTLYLEQ